MRMRRQKEVQRENDYYFDFLRMALPPGQLREEAFNAKPSPKPCLEDRISEAGNPLSNSHLSVNGGAIAIASASSSSTSAVQPSLNHHSQTLSAALGFSGAFSGSSGSGSHHLNNGDLAKYQNGSPPNSHSSASSHHNNHNVQVTDANGDVDGEDVSSSGGGGGGGKGGKASGKQGQPSSAAKEVLSKEALRRNKEAKMTKEEMVAKLENDTKRLKVDLQISRNKENDLRDQIISSMSSERHLKSEISNLQVEKSVLESRISGLLSTRASEKVGITSEMWDMESILRSKNQFHRVSQ